MPSLSPSGVPPSFLIKVVNLWMLRDHTLKSLVRGPLEEKGSLPNSKASREPSLSLPQPQAWWSLGAPPL